jgi:hypothetical protein
VIEPNAFVDGMRALEGALEQHVLRGSPAQAHAFLARWLDGSCEPEVAGFLEQVARGAAHIPVCASYEFTNEETGVA